MIIGFVGKNRVGKDTSADFLINIVREIDKNIEIKRYALADPIKDIARIMFNFSEDQLYGTGKDIIDSRYDIKPRDFFQKFGTEIMQFDIYNYLPSLKNNIPTREFWIQLLLQKIHYELETNSNKLIIITDVRGNHEARRIVENGGYLIQIIKPIHNDNNHITQLEVDCIEDKYIYNTIQNSSTLENLKQQIKLIYKNIINNQTN
jgi:hypothetical protein